MPELIWFEWERCPDGYKIETIEPEFVRVTSGERPKAYANEHTPPWLRAALEYHVFVGAAEGLLIGNHYLVPKSPRRLVSNPIEEGATFLEYAECAESLESLHAFVERYGVLHRGGLLGNECFGLATHHAEGIQVYASDMRRAVDLWNVSKSDGRYERLSRHFNLGFWRQREEISDDASSTNEDFDHEPYATMYPMLRQRADGQGPPFLSIVPESLDSALWLQFAQAVSSNTQLRRCAVCPTWFSYGTGTGRRKSAHYCSDKCRKAAHRRQKAGKDNG